MIRKMFFNDEYDNIWKNRLNLSIDTSFWSPYNTWPGGNEHHLVFLIPYKGNLEKTKLIQKELEMTGLFIPFPREYLHITLKGVGLYKTQDELYEKAEKYYNNKINYDKIVNSVSLNYQGINFFGNVVFIQCFDDGQLKLIHGEIIKEYGLDISQKRDLENYIPHVAIGTYSSNQNIEKLFDIGEKYRGTKFGIQEINSYYLCDVIRTVKHKFPKIKFIKKFVINH